MADVPKRLVGPLYLTTSPATLYTAGTGVTTIVRNIHVASVTSSIINFTLKINSSTADGVQALYYTYTLPSFGALDWSGILVLAPTDYLAGYSGTASVCVMTISGVESS